MAQEDRESALEKLAGYFGGGIKKTIEAKKKRKKELEEAAKHSQSKPQQYQDYTKPPKMKPPVKVNK